MNRDASTLLKSWAARREPTPEHRGESISRLRRALASERFLCVEEAPAFTAARVARARFAWALSGAAGACAIMLMLSSPFRQPDAARPELAQIPLAKAAELHRVYGEAMALFEDHLRWMATSNGDIQMGVSPESGPADRSGPPVLVRLTLVARSRGGRDWRPLWTADLLTRKEEWVDWAPGGKPENRVRMWVMSNPDGSYVVDSNVAMDAPVPLRNDSLRVLKPGQSAEILAIDAGAEEYRLYQEIQPLTVKRGGV